MNEQLEEKLEDLRRYSSKLRRYAEYDKEQILEDEEVEATVERYLNLAIEIVVQISQMLISRDNLEKPDTYRGTIEVLGKNEILPRRFAADFAPIAGLRNLLIHRYGTVDAERVVDELQDNVDHFDTFARHIASYVTNE